MIKSMTGYGSAKGNTGEHGEDAQHHCLLGEQIEAHNAGHQ